MTLGQRIKTARIAAGLSSQLKLAEACGWESASRIGNYEQDTREPSLEDLRLIAKAVEASGRSYGWLVLGPEELAQEAASQAARLDPDVLAIAAQTARDIAERPIDPIGDAEFIAQTYNKLVGLANKPVPPAVVVELVRWYGERYGSRGIPESGSTSSERPRSRSKKAAKA